MGEIDQAVFLVLNYFDVFKIADPRSLSVLGLSKDEIDSVLRALTEKGLIRKLNDEFEVSDLGEKEAARRRREMLESSGRKEEFLKYCEEFEEVNRRFKDLVTRWQLKNENGELVPNDHSDPDYDLALIEELNGIHRETVEILEKLATIFPFFKKYVPRFEKALSLLMDGDLGYMADSDKQSYHTIWFELHETLLKMSGMKRVE